MVKKRTSKKPSKASKSKKPSKAKAAEKAPKAEKVNKIDAGHVVNGIAVSTPSGKKPGKRGASAFLKLSQIKVQPGFNPRMHVGDVDELAASIKKVGLLHALTVRPSGDGKTFWLVAGERRYVALKSLGSPFVDSVAANIRVDLQDDDIASKAVAVAENSEDGRSNLSHVELGRVFAEMVKQQWTVSAIAAQTCVHPKKVRRVLELVDLPKTILAKVEANELAPMAALEISKLPRDRQEAVMSRVGPGATVASVRDMRKQMDREERRESVAKGEDSTRTKRGSARESAPTAWKPARVKQVMLREMCHIFQHSEERGTDSWHESRGTIAALLWDRGDLDSPVLASIIPDSNPDPAEAKKANTLFDSLVKNEAALHVPEDGDGEAGDEEADTTDADEADVEKATKKKKRKKTKKNKG